MPTSLSLLPFEEVFLRNPEFEASCWHKLGPENDEEVYVKLDKSLQRLARSKISEKTISVFGFYRLAFLSGKGDNWEEIL